MTVRFIVCRSGHGLARLKMQGSKLVVQGIILVVKILLVARVLAIFPVP